MFHYFQLLFNKIYFIVIIIKIITNINYYTLFLKIINIIKKMNLLIYLLLIIVINILFNKFIDLIVSFLIIN
jgi:hypothetical protein